MSGHSKWHSIKHKKEAADAKRGKQFTQLAHHIKLAAKEGGNDPKLNAALAEAISRAKSANMPQVNIDRLLSKADDANNETITYEAFGPSGTSLIIIASTDNSRRTVSSIRTILKEHHGSLGQPGSVAWKFEVGPKGHVPKYPQAISNETKEKLDNLVATLLDDDDIDQVYQDT